MCNERVKEKEKISYLGRNTLYLDALYFHGEYTRDALPCTSHFVSLALIFPTEYNIFL